MVQQPDTVPLRGGLDLISPGMLVKPGFCLAAKNYEVDARGYTRMAGFEAYDGQPSPSESAYHALFVEAMNRQALDGETVTGLTSGATGILLADAALDPDSPPASARTWADLAGYAWNAIRGRWNIGAAHGHLALFSVTGTFQTGEELQVGGVTFATADGSQVLNGAPTPELHETYTALAAAEARGLAAQPPGSGPIRGVATYRGDVLCWRDTGDGLAGQMFRATVTGWQKMTFGRTLRFTAGKTAFLEGETVKGGTSLATATIQRVVRNEGSWNATSGDAAGYLVLSGVSGAFQSGEALTSASGSASANGVDQAITLPAGGTYRTIEHNFFGQATSARLYATNGVGPAFEWDGAVLAPVWTGLPDALETPKFVAIHRSHLFLGYAQGSIAYSALGQPLVFDAVQGAGEFGFGAALTGLQSFTMDSLIIAARNRIGYLTGTDAGNFDLKITSPNSGAYTDTLQVVGSPIFMDDQGVRDMQTAETYGDWKLGTVTRLIEPLVRTKREAGIRPVGALRVRAKDQYRLFYSDGSGLVVYFGRQPAEILPFDYGFVPSCLCAGENADGEEMLFAGSADGWVYRLDRGTSFNGAVIPAFLRLGFLNQRRPNQEKRYHRAIIEGHSDGQAAQLTLAAIFSYGTAHVPPAAGAAFDLDGGGAFWTEAFWEDTRGWGTETEGRAVSPLDGIGTNVSLLLRSETATAAPHTLSVLTVNWSPRRRMR